MPAPRINMRKLKDALRLKLQGGQSHQQIADALGISKGVVTKYVGLAVAAALDWPAVQALDDATLERRLLSAAQQVPTYARANYGRIHQELRRKGVTLMLDCALDSEAVAPNVYRLVLDGCPVSEARPSPRPALIISARGLAAQSLPSATSEEVGSRAERDQSVSGIRR